MKTRLLWSVGTGALAVLAFAAGRATAPSPAKASPSEGMISARLSALADLVTQQSRDTARRFESLAADCRNPVAPNISTAVTVAPVPALPTAAPPRPFEPSAATALIDRALPTGRWTPDDIRAFRRAMPDMSPEQRESAVHALTQAINSGTLVPTEPGAPM